MVNLQKDNVALGLDLGGSSIKWGVLAPDGTIGVSGREPLPDRESKTVVTLLGKIITDARKTFGERLCGIGIGSPGLVSADRRIVRQPPNFPTWHNLPLADLLRPFAGDLPVTLENDANLLVYSETRWGAAVGCRNVVVLTLGTGVGGGVMVNGAVMRGAGGGAAELGHMTLNYESDVHCLCGSVGCFEVLCNIAATMREVADVYGNSADAPATPEALTKAAKSGDEKAILVWKRIGKRLGVGIANIVNIFNPEIILIGGGLSGAGELLLGEARVVAESMCYATSWAETKVEIAGLKAQSGLFGAAALAFESAGVKTEIKENE